MPFFYSPSTKAFYDATLVYPNLPRDVIAISDEQHAEMVHAVNVLHKDIVSGGGAFGYQDRPPPVLTWDDIRARRNRLLAASDWSQLPDIPDAVRAAWAPYRQALRDVPQSGGDPAAVVWPNPPS